MRGLYKPSTVRCVDTKVQRHHGYTTIRDWKVPTGIGILKCYADLQVNEYIVGSGPSVLTVLVTAVQYWNQDATAKQIAALRADAERILLGGDGHHRHIKGVPAGGITNVESIMFLGPELDASVERWEVFSTWNMERTDDGTVMVVHPHRFWWQHRPNVTTEWTLPTFKTDAQAAHTARLSDYGGRIGKETSLPRLVTNANNLNAFHVETGNTTHADGPPETSLPPPCGKAVPNQAKNPGLMQDCMALLAAKDTLRGTGTLNWSVDTTISSWDGVTTSATTSGAGGASGSTASRVTGIALANKGLTGNVPAELEELDLTTLNLTGNSLTGCIPVGLKSITTNDLSTLNLLYCPPAPAPTTHSAGETSFTASWPAIANTSKYRLQYQLATASAWTTASDTITATSYSLGGLQCGTAYRFRLSAHGSGTVYTAAWSDPWEVVAITTACATPAFGKASYAFSVAENSAGGTSVGSVSATDPNSDALTYSITGGNTGSAFAIGGSTGTVTVKGSLNYETTSSYTLTVEASDGTNKATATVTVTVTNVNETPSFASSSYSFSVANRARVGTGVGSVTATDPDGDTLAYSITGGNTGNAFAVNGSTGVITVAGSVSQSNPFYALTVQASDGKGGTASATVTIIVTRGSQCPPGHVCIGGEEEE